MKRLTPRDWDNILTALNMVAADAWDDRSYGPRPDWEALIKKIEDRKH